MSILVSSEPCQCSGAVSNPDDRQTSHRRHQKASKDVRQPAACQHRPSTCRAQSWWGKPFASSTQATALTSNASITFKCALKLPLGESRRTTTQPAITKPINLQPEIQKRRLLEALLRVFAIFKWFSIVDTKKPVALCIAVLKVLVPSGKRPHVPSRIWLGCGATRTAGCICR